jgi:hypothetical protein
VEYHVCECEEVLKKIDRLEEESGESVLWSA